MMARKYTLSEIREKDLLKISELAELTGVRYPTVWYYASIGLIPFEQRENRRARYFPREICVERLKRIEELKRQGRSISEILAELVTDEQK